MTLNLVSNWYQQNVSEMNESNCEGMSKAKGRAARTKQCGNLQIRLGWNWRNRAANGNLNVTERVREDDRNR